MSAPDDPRQRLLEAAGAIFAEKGKQLATVRQIIEKAGVNVAAVLGGILDELLPADVPAVKRHLLAHSIVAQCLHYLLARPIVTLLVGEAEFAGYDVETLTEHIAEFSLAALGVRAPGYRKGKRS